MDLDLPLPSRGLVIATYVFLGLLFLVGLGAITWLPSLSAGVARNLPEYADLRDPLLALVVAITVLGLVVLAMVGLLVHRISTGTMLTRASVLWVDVIIAALVCAAALIVTAFFVISAGQAGSPFLLLAQTSACIALVALVCIMLVLRSLLSSAIVLRAELEEVV